MRARLRPLRPMAFALSAAASTLIFVNACGNQPTADNPSGTPNNLSSTGAITLAPVGRIFDVARTGPQPLAKTISVTSSGTQITNLVRSAITYGAGATGWLTTAALSGTSTPATLTLRPAAPGSIPVGTYTASFTLSGTGATNSPSITVTLHVTNSPWISVVPAGRNFSYIQGDPQPNAKTITVNNGGTSGTTLSGLTVSSITYAGGQPTGWLTTATLAGGTAPTTLTLRPTPGVLTPGTYTATVRIGSGVALNSPLAITVKLTVTAPTTPRISVSPTGRMFTAAAGGAQPAARTIAITNSGTGSLTGLGIGTITYGPGATGWLTTASLNTTTAPATLTLRPAAPGALGAGTYTADVPITSGVAGNSPVHVTATYTITSLSQYQVTVQFISSMTPSQQATFISAANRWGTIITGDLTDIPINLAQDACFSGQPPVNTTVDDILIMARIIPIDGPGGILGQAGPCLIRNSNGLPVFGLMSFDDADVANMEANGTFGDVILHEMGHVLGIGSLWNSVFSLIVPTSMDSLHPYFFGSNARTQFDAVGGLNFAFNKVPIENCCGPGTRDAHWRETNSFMNELMTGFIAGPGNPLSVVTIGSLADEGYTVDYSMADPYTFTGTTIRAPGGPTPVELKDDVLRLPVWKVHGDGSMQRVQLPW